MLAPYCEPKLFTKLKIIQNLHIDEIFYPVVRLRKMKERTKKTLLQRLYDCASSKKEKDIFDLTKKKGIQNNSMVERHIS